MAVEVKSTISSFGGKVLKLSHKSTTTGTDMAFNLYLPPAAFSSSSSSSSSSTSTSTSNKKKIPLLIFLSGLTCTPDNCTEKGFLQHSASKHNMAILYPDTSPRGLDIPGAKDTYDFGEAASFYINATNPAYAPNYKMETYLTTELPEVVFGSKETHGAELDQTRVAITGHSMGGHGALSLYLKYPGKYVSCSAFAPIANPVNGPWGKKAFGGYLGEDQLEEWKKHDSTELVKKGYKGDKFNVLIDVGTNDHAYKGGELLVENFEKAVKEAGLGDGLELRFQEGYDHSYFTIATFADDHVAHAAKFLGV